jgi:hypothetical protein
MQTGSLYVVSVQFPLSIFLRQMSYHTAQIHLLFVCLFVFLRVWEVTGSTVDTNGARPCRHLTSLRPQIL